MAISRRRRSPVSFAAKKTSPTFIMMSTNRELSATKERRYCPFSLNLWASVLPASISTSRCAGSPVSRHQRCGVLDRLFQPVVGFVGIRRRVLAEDPHHPGQESVAPVGPRRTLQLPFSFLRM